MDCSLDELVNIANDIIISNKGEELSLFDVRNQGNVTDFHLVTCFESEKQVRAVGKLILKKLKQERSILPRLSGEISGGWVVLDCNNAIIHIFTREAKEYYQIEEIWAD